METITPLDGPFFLANGHCFLNFCSSDPLGLSNHPDLKKNAIRFILQYGTSNSSLLLPEGELSCESLVKRKLKDLLGKESVLLFSSILYAEQAVHAFLGSNVTHTIHSLLSETSGYLCDPKTLYKTNGSLFIDDRHAFGLYGKRGMGLAAHLDSVTLILGSFSICGTPGGYVATSHLLLEQIIKSFPYSPESGIPPASLGIIDAALDLIPTMDGERAELHQKVHFLNHQLQEMGFTTSCQAFRILIHFETEEEATLYWKRLHASGIYTELKTMKTLKVSLCLQHTSEQLNQFLEALKKVVLCFQI